MAKKAKKYVEMLNNLLLVVLITFAVYLIIKNFVIPYFKRPQPLLKEELSSLKPRQLISTNTYEIKISKTSYVGYGQDFRKGNDDASIKIVVFSDFECPACGLMYQALKEVFYTYKDQILLVYKNFPLDNACNHNVTRKFHEHSCQIAILARCAGNKGNFWKFHDQIYENQNKISDNFILKVAKEYGNLTDKEVQECLNSTDMLNKIKEDIAQADNLQISETPTTFINGRKYIGPPYAEYLIKAIEENKSVN